MPSAKGQFTAELIALLGQDKTRALIAAYGGHYLYVPHISAGHPIENVVGEAAARLLSERYAGLRLLIPLGRQWALQARNRAIREAHEGGASVSDLVTRFRLSPRQVYNVLAAPDNATLHTEQSQTQRRQLSLF